MTAIDSAAPAPDQAEDISSARPRSALRRGPRGPLGWLLNLFSSVRFGIVLMTLLFIYASIGSAGLPVEIKFWEPAAWMNVRELVEMSEFQWFHWWPFDLLIALFCLTLAVTTVRRIPLNVLTLGVWSIHSGLIVLAIGSVIYFTMKKEGDVPVPRRQVVIEVPGGEPVTMVATPGNETVVGTGPDARHFRVQQITPDWELLSGDDAGRRAYKVTVAVTGPDGMFLRELIDGFPQYTEDLVRNPQGPQPFSRAIKVTGEKLVDASLQLGLEPVVADHFYLMESRAIYVREVGAAEWVERPVPWMPLFRDHLHDAGAVWPDPSGEAAPELRPVSVSVPPVDPADPLPGVTFRIGDYLRYAVLQDRRLPGGANFDPVARISLTGSDGNRQQYELAALDPAANTALRGSLRFNWAADEAEAARWLEPRSSAIVLADGTRVPVIATAQADPGLAFTPVPGTDFSWRVQSVEDGLEIAGRVVSLAKIDVRKGDAMFTRWVFDDPALTRDVPDGEMIDAHVGGTWDRGLDLSYEPGDPIAIRIVAGPGESQLRASIPRPDLGAQIMDLQVGQPLVIATGISLVIDAYAPRSRTETRPMVVPIPQRDRDVGMQASLVRLEVPGASAGAPAWDGWLTFHQYPFDRPEEVIRRFRYEPVRVDLPDGRAFEVMFSRQRHPLTNPVRLESFEIEARLGGFDGGTSSIKDWFSSVSFDESGGDAAWGGPVDVHVNHPKPSGGYWFFQAQWDPPDQPRFEGDPGSNGLNYTVLGVGNRHGVRIQLFGTILTVLGMCYAFYVKPWIKRRRAQAVHAQLAAARAGGEGVVR